MVYLAWLTIQTHSIPNLLCFSTTFAAVSVNTDLVSDPKRKPAPFGKLGRNGMHHLLQQKGIHYLDGFCGAAQKCPELVAMRITDSVL
ncbi:hypothetical protein F5144DRAFT_366533 [Chaetomium tenue]|uniref:Uncharacterized protein n=1 Tax=Chaetomium tenue TaxID=1854479 RepID=A0ACB7NZ86_9PEZI|nr:hypothetical protein F5144DRAFT_366533 [Chaetomium globosum]